MNQSSRLRGNPFTSDSLLPAKPERSRINPFKAVAIPALIASLLMLNGLSAATEHADRTNDILWVENVTGAQGDTLTVGIYVHNPDSPLDAFTLDFEYDPAMLDYVSCERGDLTAGWPFLGCNLITPGHIRAGGFDIQSIPLDSTGTILILTFTVACDACSYGQEGQLRPYNLQDDIAGWHFEKGYFTFIGNHPIPACGIPALMLLTLGLSLLLGRRRVKAGL